APAEARQRRVRRTLRAHRPEHLGRGAPRAAAGRQPALMRTAARDHHGRISWFGYAASLAAVLTLWQYGSSQALIPLLFPSPISTWRTAVQLAQEGRLATDIAISLQRIALGFAIG